MSQILLDSGTNELEIVEFTIGNNKFGINVIKVREIIVPQIIYPIPQSHPNIEGLVKLREEVLPVVDLAGVLGLNRPEQGEKDKFIVAEFNKMKVIFHVHDVSFIRRISWEDIVTPTDFNEIENGNVTGVIKLDTHIIILLDFEKIMVDINPNSGLDRKMHLDLSKRKHYENRIVIAEDSLLLQKLLKETLEKAGYQQLTFFANGKEALTFLETQEKNAVDLLITDIEMPQMDGHHLTKRLRESHQWGALPIVIFSSLITNDLRHKGEKVGANAQISKPEIGELIEQVDILVGNIA